MGKKYLRLNGRAYKKQDLSVFSTGTKVKSQAQQLHDNFKNELWRQTSLPTLPQKYWMDAVIRWLDESKHKQSLGDDKIHLRWADPFLRNTLLTDITQDDIEAVAKAREEKRRVSPLLRSTVCLKSSVQFFVKHTANGVGCI